jgi:lysophospholipase L1-like esterase
LANERLRTIAAASAIGATFLDLNAASRAFVNAIGEEAAHAFNLKESDNTHLNDEGSIVFGRLVADLLLEKLPQLDKFFKSDCKLSCEIWGAINGN